MAVIFNDFGNFFLKQISLDIFSKIPEILLAYVSEIGSGSHSVQLLYHMIFQMEFPNSLRRKGLSFSLN